MSKKTKKFKIELNEDEHYVIVKKTSSVLILNEGDNNGTALELIIPNKKDVEHLTTSNGINLALAIATKCKYDHVFVENLLHWFDDYMDSQVDAAYVN